jgi:hypothetical protein
MKLAFLLILPGLLSTSAALAQEGVAAATTTATASAATNRLSEDAAPAQLAKPAEPGSAVTTAHAPGVEEVLAMLKAGVSKEVILAYVQSSTRPYNLAGSDLIALKKAGVPDELTMAMVKRGAELRLQAMNSQPGSRLTGPAMGSPMRGAQGLDPEGYDFWWYHYAYPRALASANERMLAPLAPFADSYYYPALPFRPRPLSRFSLQP